MAYEYEVRRYEAEPLLGDDLASTLTKELNAMAQAGWEPILINMIDKQTLAWVTFKRPVAK